MSDTPEHLVKSYDAELKRLRAKMAEMGGMVENQVALATRAILDRDTDAAASAVEEDPKVDALERAVRREFPEILHVVGHAEPAR